jgi:cellulose synthase/poly-beta-1,6-N-acetylglucosamine synthase-like glycosyltransferase
MHTLLIFAFCNFDDMSWGTKGLDTVGGISLENIPADQKQKLLEN